MKPNFVIMIFILFCCVLDVSAAGVDACGGCYEGQICRSYKEGNIRIHECIAAEQAPPATPQTPPSANPPCNETTCPPPMMCVRDNWASNLGFCVFPPDDKSNDKQSPQDAAPCSAEFNALLDTCRVEVQSATNSCDEKQDAGLNSVSNQASQLAVMMGQMAASSIQAACSKMAKISQGANAAVAAYQLACSNSIGSCKSSCAAAKNYLQANESCIRGPLTVSNAVNNVSLTLEVNAELEKCYNLTANVNAANMAIQNYVGTAANAAQCEALNDGTGVLPEICKTDPKNPICVKPGEMDCTKPEMATNKICVCTKNPLDPMCSTGQKVGGGIGAGGGNIIDSSSRLANKSDGGRTGDIPSLPGIEQGEFKDSGGAVGPDAEKVGNGGVGGGGGGGGGGGSGGGRRAAGGFGGGDDESSKVVSGFYGGGGGTNGFGSRGSGGGNNGAYVPGAGGVVSKGNMQPDLRKFLPGGQYDPRRLISGISGPDGITGPHSNIWLKIQNRYQLMRGSLLP